MGKRKEITCKWIHKALRDLQAAKILLREGFYGESTFHAQQAAEKALKALITGLGIQPPKTHQIEILLMIIQRKGITIEPVRDASVLTDYAVETRYPDFEPEPTIEEAEEAIKIAKKTLEWTVQELKRQSIEC